MEEADHSHRRKTILKPPRDVSKNSQCRDYNGNERVTNQLLTNNRTDNICTQLDQGSELCIEGLIDSNNVGVPQLSSSNHKLIWLIQNLHYGSRKIKARCGFVHDAADLICCDVSCSLSLQNCSAREVDTEV